MEQKMNKVIRSSMELGYDNPILSIHDQGAGGNGNVLKELIDGLGATLNLDNLEYGTNNISVIETWLSEYQESNALLTYKEHLQTLESLCDREGVNLSILGHITGDGILTLTCQDNQYKATLNYEKEYKENSPRQYKLLITNLFPRTHFLNMIKIIQLNYWQVIMMFLKFLILY